MWKCVYFRVSDNIDAKEDRADQVGSTSSLAKLRLIREFAKVSLFIVHQDLLK